MAYTPSDKILKKYANVLVNFALGMGKGIVAAGGHVIGHYSPDEEQGDKRRNESFTRYFYEYAKDHQLDFFPDKYLKGLVEQMDHSLFILSDSDPHALKGVDPKKIMRRGLALKPFMDWRRDKEHKGKFSGSFCMYGTPAMAKEAGLSEKEYLDQIFKACFLDEKSPIKKWKAVYKEIEKYKKKLNVLSPKIDRLHVKGPDVDLWVKLGEKRQWLAGRGVNMPSFEIFTSPDWRGTNGWIKFNQPLYRYGSKVTGIELEFKNGKVIKSKAKTNERLLKEMIATKGADKMGEYSLTDKRHSRITKFMAETLYDEKVGGRYGNTHLALGMSYRDTFSGDVSKLTTKQAEKLGFNDSSVHTDIVSTTRRTVTAHLKNGKTKVIYKDGEFVL